MILRYPATAVLGDYARAGTGLAVCGAPLVSGGMPAIVSALLAGGAVLFAVYGIQTAARHRTRIRVDEGGIDASPAGTRLAWGGIRRVRLAYFSVRQDGRDGWMELRLEGAEGRLRVDSRIEGFREIAAHAARAARRAGLDLDPATAGNFAALGLEAGAGASGAPS